MALQGIACPHCGAVSPYGELFCAECGRQLPRPSPEAALRVLDAEAQEKARKSRRDLLVSAAVAVVMGLATLLLSDTAPAGSLEASAGRDWWWLFGLLWGFVVWMVRRRVHWEL